MVTIQQTATVALVYFDGTARLEESLEQMKVHTKMAVDGKEDRFKAEKYAEEWEAGAILPIHRARQRQLSERLQLRSSFARKPQKLTFRRFF